MTREQQKAYLRDCLESFVHSMSKKIDEGKVPECWDGHELRVWLAEKVKGDASASLIRRHPHSARAREFRNDVIVNNL